MVTGSTLLNEGKFSKAVTVLKREASRDWQDDFAVGPICDLGFALLLKGDREGAEAHFRDLIDSHTHSVSAHFIGLGMVEWFGKNDDAAFRIWKRGLRARMKGDDGLDVALLLLFASLRHKWRFMIWPLPN